MLEVTNDWLEICGETPMLPSNIWCLVTAENQRRADERIPLLLQVRAQVRGVSLEPMLEPIDLMEYLRYRFSGQHNVGLPDNWPPLDWVVVGAESGPNRRPFETAWAEDVYRQCQERGVPFFGKQDSGLHPGVPLLINGQEIKEFPRLDK